MNLFQAAGLHALYLEMIADTLVKGEPWVVARKGEPAFSVISLDQLVQIWVENGIYPSAEAAQEKLLGIEDALGNHF